MKFLYLSAISLFLLSCESTKMVPLKGKYSDGNFVAYSDKSKEKIWDNIIDFFAKNGLSIRIIDKSSGLIISGTTSLDWTYENKNGALVHSDAWVVIAKTQYISKTIEVGRVIGEWNIRIKEENGKTSININLVNPSYYYKNATVATANPTSFKSGYCKSTGKFEESIYQIIK